MEVQALAALNRLRAEFSLEPIDADYALSGLNGHQVGTHYYFEKFGWKMMYRSVDDSIHTIPPRPFDPEFPRCPMTGELYDAEGPVTQCDHDWEWVTDDIRQCLRCKHGERFETEPEWEYHSD